MATETLRTIHGVRPGLAPLLASCPSLDGEVRQRTPLSIHFVTRRLAGIVTAFLMMLANEGAIGAEPVKPSTIKNPQSDAGTQVYDRAATSTVTISHKNGHGSGFICYDAIGKRKVLVTNYHVVKGSPWLSLLNWKTGAKGKVYVSHAFFVDPQRDLAVFPVPKELNYLPALKIATKAIKGGEAVWAAGAPRNIPFSVSPGTCTSLLFSKKRGRHVILTNASINPGNSGGPLLNKKSEVVGIVTYVMRNADGLNFAVNVSELLALLAGRPPSRSLHSPRVQTPPRPTDPNYKPSSGGQYIAGPYGILYCKVAPFV